MKVNFGCASLISGNFTFNGGYIGLNFTLGSYFPSPSSFAQLRHHPRLHLRLYNTTPQNFVTQHHTTHYNEAIEIILTPKVYNTVEQPDKPARDKQGSNPKQDSRKMGKRVGLFSGAKLRKSNDERDTALSKVGELKANLKHSNDTTEKLRKEIIQLQSKLEKVTDQRDVALSHVGELKADLKAASDSEGKALEAIELRSERDTIIFERDAALKKVKKLETEVEGLKEVRIVANTVSAPSAAKPTSKKRKIDALEAFSAQPNKRKSTSNMDRDAEDLAQHCPRSSL